MKSVLTFEVHPHKSNILLLYVQRFPQVDCRQVCFHRMDHFADITVETYNVKYV